MAVGQPSLIMGYRGLTNTITSTAQCFWQFAGIISNSQHLAVPSEAITQTPFQNAGTMSNLSINIKTAATGTSTVVLRNNKVTVNESISIGSGSTGYFSDSLNTDNINGGDLLDVAITAGSTALLPTVIATTFVCSTASQAVTRIGNVYSLTPAGGTFFMSPVGQASGNVESDSKNRQEESFTIKNLAVQVEENGTGGTSTFRSRKNGANGNLNISATASSTGLFQDTSNSDSIALNDDYNYTFTDNTTGGNHFIPVFCSAEFISGTGDVIFTNANDSGLSFNPSTSTYLGLTGLMDAGQTTESNAQVTVQSNFLFTKLLVKVKSNSISATSFVGLHANGNNEMTVSITLNTTGVFTTSDPDYQASTTDAMNFDVVPGSTGTSITITQISVWANATPAPTGGGPGYRNFRNVLTRKGQQDYKSFGMQMIVFG